MIEVGNGTEKHSGNTMIDYIRAALAWFDTKFIIDRKVDNDLFFKEMNFIQHNLLKSMDELDFERKEDLKYLQRRVEVAEKLETQVEKLKNL